MRTLVIGSEKFKGYVEITYDDENRLSVLDFSNSTVNDRQIKWFLSTVPPVYAKMNITGLTIQETVKEITFEDFWNRYDYKSFSSLKRTREKWKRMSKLDQLKAFKHIPVYFNIIPPGVRKRNAERYLNDELWNN